MPELPEVQTVVSQLGAKIVGKTMGSVWSDWRKNVRPSLLYFEKACVGAAVIGARRKGKHIVIDLDNNYSIVIHLKMTGHLLVKTEENAGSDAFKDPYNQFIRHRIVFTDKTRMDFSDMRKFGWMAVMETPDVETLESVRTLGIDALSDGFTEEVFGDILKKRAKVKIGTVLLNQSVIAGIGNIYRSESLFLAGILPDRPAGSLSEEERKKLLSSIKTVLHRALKFRGMSDGDFRDTDGLPGEFQKVAGVYDREGKPCPKCGTMVQRIKMGQRSAFFCPQCQK